MGAGSYYGLVGGAAVLAGIVFLIATLLDNPPLSPNERTNWLMIGAALSVAAVILAGIAQRRSTSQI